MYQTKFIVLSKKEVNEYDQLITCYSRLFGKLKILAKGYHKNESKLRGHLDELDLAEGIIIPGNYYSKIRSVISLSKWPKSASDFRHLTCALVVSELFEKEIFELQPDDKLWGLLNSYLEQIKLASQGGYNHNQSSELLITFLLRFLEINGHPIPTLNKEVEGPQIKTSENTLGKLADFLKQYHQLNLNTLSLVNSW